MVQYLDIMDNTFKNVFHTVEDEENAIISILGDDLIIEYDDDVTMGAYLWGNAASETEDITIIRGKENWRMVES